MFIINGLIHLLGFAKAVDPIRITQITQPVSFPAGILWLISSLLFVIAGVTLAIKADFWWAVGTAAVIISQILIILFWGDARFGTIANLIVFVALIIGFSTWNFRQQFRKDVAIGLERNGGAKEELLLESDMQGLPQIVRDYLEYTGAVDKPKVRNVRIEFEAEMRNRNQDWFRLTTDQYNFFDRFERLFFLDARIRGFPAHGYHRYKNGRSGMDIKLLSLLPVVHARGEEMFHAETVTMLNDMCLFAPATLIDERIRWEPVDSNSVRAFFSNSGHTISAVLYFNEKSQLINFVSDDRYDITEMKQYRFSTPVDNYREINGYNLCTYGEAIWHYPDGEFTYGRYRLRNLQYNVADFTW